MSVENLTFAGFGVRVNLTSKIFLEEKSLGFREHVWGLLNENEKEYYPEGMDEYFGEDYFDVDNFSDKFPELIFVWCGNPYYPMVPKVDEWFVFAKSAYVRLRGVAEWADLSTHSRVSPEVLTQLSLFDELALDGAPRWYLGTCVV